MSKNKLAEDLNAGYDKLEDLFHELSELLTDFANFFGAFFQEVSDTFLDVLHGDFPGTRKNHRQDVARIEELVQDFKMSGKKASDTMDAVRYLQQASQVMSKSVQDGYYNLSALMDLLDETRYLGVYKADSLQEKLAKLRAKLQLSSSATNYEHRYIVSSIDPSYWLAAVEGDTTFPYISRIYMERLGSLRAIAQDMSKESSGGISVFFEENERYRATRGKYAWNGTDDRQLRLSFDTIDSSKLRTVPIDTSAWRLKPASSPYVDSFEEEYQFWHKEPLEMASESKGISPLVDAFLLDKARFESEIYPRKIEGLVMTHSFKRKLFDELTRGTKMFKANWWKDAIYGITVSFVDDNSELIHPYAFFVDNPTRTFRKD